MDFKTETQLRAEIAAVWQLLDAYRSTKIQVPVAWMACCQGQDVCFFVEEPSDERFPKGPCWKVPLFDVPINDTALKEALQAEFNRGYEKGVAGYHESVKAAKKEALLEAADTLGFGKMAEFKLRRMAEELK